MINRSISIFVIISTAILTLGCGGTKCLIDDCNSVNVSSQVIEIKEGENKEILDYKRGMIWGGYAPGLFSVDTSTVSIDYTETRRGHKVIIKGKTLGSTKVYLVNRFGAGSIVNDSTEREYWIDRLEGSKSYFTVEVK